MRRTNVWIEISRDWIELAVVSGGNVRRVHRILIDPGGPSGAGTRAEGALNSAALRHHISHGLSVLNVTGGGVNVVWHGPNCWVDAHTIGAPPAAAPEAAILACCAANAIDQEAWSTSAHIVASRRDPSGGTECNVLVSAVRNDVLSDIEASVEEAGCVLRGVIPAPSIGLLQASRRAIDLSAGEDRPVVCIHTSEEATCVGVARAGALLLARTIEMGFSTLREAYIRAEESSSRSYPQAFLAANRRLLETEGVPSPSSGDAGAIAVFQSARPFLQRLFVEIKQTVRFTIEEGELDVCRVWLGGPGAGIPRFAAMLRAEVGFESLEAVESAAPPTEPGRGIGESLRAGASALAVLPPGRVELRERTTRRAALLYGAVAASVLLAADAYTALQRSAASESAARALEGEIEVLGARAEAGMGMDPRALVHALEGVIRSESGARADCGAALAEIAGMRPAGVWLTGVSGERDRAGSTIRFDAIMDPTGGGVDPHERIAAFVESLQSSELFADARLGTTEQLASGEDRQVRFAVSLTLHETQAPWFDSGAGP